MFTKDSSAPLPCRMTGLSRRIPGLLPRRMTGFTILRHNSGFTIVELLVVIVIIAILATLTIVSYIGITRNATVSAIKANLSNANKALANYRTLNNETYPLTIDCSGSNYGLTTNLCLSPGNNIDYVYSVDNSNPPSFTLYAQNTDKSITYKLTSSNSTYSEVSQNKTCPNNFILVPGSTTYGTSDFCVAKYEMKQYNTALGTNTASSTNYPVSRPGGTPWVTISQNTANSNSPYTVDGNGTLLTSQGYASPHLITEAEWMTIAQNVLQQPKNWSSGTIGTGFIYNGHVNNNPGTGLSASGSDANSNYGEDTYNNSSVNANNKRTLTLSNGEVIWDFSGNVYDWTQGTIAANAQPGLTSDAGYVWHQWNASGLIQNGFPSSSMPSSMASGALSNITTWTTANGIGNLYSNYNNGVDTTNPLRGFRRGGYWANGSSAGVLALHLYNGPTYTYASIGFRVAISPSQ